MALWIALAVVVIIVLTGISGYNAMVRLRNEVANQFAEIDVVLTQRYDLIPNLVEVAKKYMQHEQETLTKVIEARNNASQALGDAKQAPDELKRLGQAESSLAKSLAGMYVVFENYPELQADTQMLQLQGDIAQTEDKVAFARTVYNNGVTGYNNFIQTFPNNLYNLLFGFKVANWLEIEGEKRQAVKVSFD